MGVPFFKFSIPIRQKEAPCPQAGGVLHSFTAVIHSFFGLLKMLSKQSPLNVGIRLGISDSKWMVLSTIPKKRADSKESALKFV